MGATANPDEMDSLEAAATLTEMERVLLHRFNEAREAGLTLVESHRFAESSTDVGQLRRLVAKNCPAAMIAKILL